MGTRAGNVYRNQPQSHRATEQVGGRPFPRAEAGWVARCNTLPAAHWRAADFAFILNTSLSSNVR